MTITHKFINFTKACREVDNIQTPKKFMMAKHHPSFSLKPLASIVAFGFSSVAWAQPPVQHENLDWVPWENLSVEQQASLPDGCCGLYIEPPLPAKNIDQPNKTEITGDSLSSDYNTGNLTITGNFKVLHNDGFMQADSATYNRPSDTFDLNGNVQIRQPGMLLVGASANIDKTNQTSQINSADYVLHEVGARGTAKMIIYSDVDGIVTIDNGLYTRCEPGDNSWVMAAKKITLNQEAGRGVARNIALKVNNIPVFYAPYISFPINDQRSSGFLSPSFGSSSDGGFDIAAPYYFNLAPNYDATLTPRIISERGVMVSLEGRYQSHKWNNVLDLNYLPGDKLYDADNALLPIGDSDRVSPSTEDRWLINYDYYARYNADWSANIDYTSASDAGYFQDIGNNGGLYGTTESYLQRTARLDYSGENWTFYTRLLNLQLIDPSISELNLPYQILPSFNLKGDFSNDLGFEYGVNAEYTMFDRSISDSDISQTQLNNGALVTGQRLSIEPTVSWPWSTPGIFFTPTAKYKYATYQLDNQALDSTDTPSRGIFTSTIDSGLIFEREFSFNSDNYTQTLEPRLFYLYSEFEDQSDIPVFDSAAMTFGYNQLFRDDRFSGKDRIGDSNQLTLALTSRFFDKRGREKARASIGQILYFEDRRVTLGGLNNNTDQETNSSVLGDLSYQLNSNWGIKSYLEWDTVNSSISVGSFQFRYQSDINHILNVSYRYRDELNPITSNNLDRRIKQTDISTLWPLGNNWGLIARWNYDWANERNLESIVGVEYSNCCWDMRIIGRQWIDNDDLFLDENERDDDSGIFFQFELKGLGSVLGGSVSRLLGDTIAGYKAHEYR